MWSCRPVPDTNWPPKCLLNKITYPAAASTPQRRAQDQGLPLDSNRARKGMLWRSEAMFPSMLTRCNVAHGTAGYSCAAGEWNQPWPMLTTSEPEGLTTSTQSSSPKPDPTSGPTDGMPIPATSPTDMGAEVEGTCKPRASDQRIVMKLRCV